MTITTFNLRPCSLLAFHVSRRGGERIRRLNYEVEDAPEGEVTRWESERTVNDPQELAKAKSLRNTLNAAFNRIGAPGPGNTRIVAKANVEKAKAKCEELRAKAREFNKTARYSNVSVFASFFEIGGDNAEALSATLEQLQDTISELEQAVATMDPQSIRDVLPKAKSFVEVLPDDVGAVLEDAVAQARKQATIVSRADKKAARLARKLAEELGRPVEEIDLDVELERLRADAADKVSRARVRRLQKMIEDREEALEILDKYKNQVDTTAVRLARFAIQTSVLGSTSGVSEDSDTEDSDTSEQITAYQAAARNVEIL